MFSAAVGALSSNVFCLEKIKSFKLNVSPIVVLVIISSFVFVSNSLFSKLILTGVVFIFSS